MVVVGGIVGIAVVDEGVAAVGDVSAGNGAAVDEGVPMVDSGNVVVGDVVPVVNGVVS